MQAKTFNQVYKPQAAALNLALRCGCEVKILIPDQRVTIRYVEDEVGPPIIEWTIPSSRVNGSMLSLTDIKGYELAQWKGTERLPPTYAKIMYIEGGGVSSSSVELVQGINKFSIRAIDTEGLKSRWSNTKRIDL